MDELRAVSISGALFQADEADLYRWQAAVGVQNRRAGYINMNKVSVIIPVYNPDLSLLDRAVRSVQERLYTDFELLLIDDCSTDQRVLAYLEKQSADDRIRIIHQKENGGVSEARNRGILEAVGEWIAFLDQDDYY